LSTTGVTIPPLEDVTGMDLRQPLPPRRRACALIQSTYTDSDVNARGYVEAVALVGGSLVHYYRDNSGVLAYA
jgi:hypothetical protein